MLKMSLKKKKKKKHTKKSFIRKHSGMCYFSSRLDGFEITCTSIRKKTALKTLIYFKNLIFCIFEPKNCEVIENSSKAPFNFSPLKCKYLAKKLISISLALAKSEKMKLKSGHLELRFSVYEIYRNGPSSRPKGHGFASLASLRCVLEQDTLIPA